MRFILLIYLNYITSDLFKKKAVNISSKIQNCFMVEFSFKPLCTVCNVVNIILVCVILVVVIWC